MHTTLSWRRYCAIMLTLALLASRARIEAAYFEGFDNVGSITNNSDPLKWAWVNNSVSPNTDVSNGGWGQGAPSASGFNAQAGPANSFTYANFNSSSTGGAISNWFISPTFDFVAGDSMSFWTRTVTGSTYPDRLEINLSAGGTSLNVGPSATSVGDFSTNTLTINPSLAQGVYPETWTQYTINITSAFTGRVGFRYSILPDSSSAGNYIAIDSFQTSANLYVPVPEPTTYGLAAISTVLLAGLNCRRTRRNIR